MVNAFDPSVPWDLRKPRFLWVMSARVEAEYDHDGRIAQVNRTIGRRDDDTRLAAIFRYGMDVEHLSPDQSAYEAIAMSLAEDADLLEAQWYRRHLAELAAEKTRAAGERAEIRRMGDEVAAQSPAKAAMVRTLRHLWALEDRVIAGDPAAPAALRKALDEVMRAEGLEPEPKRSAS